MESLDKMETMLENLLREEAAMMGIQELYLYSCFHNQGSLRAIWIPCPDNFLFLYCFQDTKFIQQISLSMMAEYVAG